MLGAKCNAGRHKYISQLKALPLTATGNIFAAPDQYLLWWKNNAPAKKECRIKHSGTSLVVIALHESNFEIYSGSFATKFNFVIRSYWCKISLLNVLCEWNFRHVYE